MAKKKEAAPALVDHVVTQDTLDLNPELVEQGVKVGDPIQYPAKPDLAEIYDQIIAELREENESLRAQLVDQDNEIEKLNIQLEEAEEIAQDALNGYNTAAVQVANNFETEVDGQKVKVNHGVHYNGTDYTAADLVENPEVVAELLAIGSGSITILEN